GNSITRHGAGKRRGGVMVRRPVSAGGRAAQGGGGGFVFPPPLHPFFAPPNTPGKKGIPRKNNNGTAVSGHQPPPRTNLSKTPAPNPTMVAMSRITPLRCHRIIGPLAQAVSLPAMALSGTARRKRGHWKSIATMGQAAPQICRERDRCRRGRGPCRMY